MPLEISEPVRHAIPNDDPRRHLTVAKPETGDGLAHVSVAGGTYTILVRGKDTAGKYCLIDMLVPPGGGPPLHRHDFEEMFTLLEGEAEFTFRGETVIVKAGETVNVPASAPHHFVNHSNEQMRMLCLCAPAGQDEFFLNVGDLVESRTSPPPKLSDEEKKERGRRAVRLSAEYKTELL